MLAKLPNTDTSALHFIPIRKYFLEQNNCDNRDQWDASTLYSKYDDSNVATFIVMCYHLLFLARLAMSNQA